MRSIIQKAQPVRTIVIDVNQTAEIDIGSYGNMIMMGYIGNIGNVLLGFYKVGSTLTVKDLASGGVFSSQYVQFSTNEDKIVIHNTTGDQNMVLTLVYGGTLIH